MKLTQGCVSDDKTKAASGDRPVLMPTSSSVNTTKVRISGHHLRWTWTYKGTTFRQPVKTSQMRGWIKKIYNYKGAIIILNPKTMELWQESRPYKRSETMIYANWNKADLIARQFSQFAQIAIKPIHSEHPADLQGAHMVVENKPFSKVLKGYEGKAPRVGLQFDKSHRSRAELTGKESAEGAMGLDYWLIDFPARVSMLMESFDDYNLNIKLHLKAIQELRDAVKELKPEARRKRRGNDEQRRNNHRLQEQPRVL